MAVYHFYKQHTQGEMLSLRREELAKCAAIHATLEGGSHSAPWSNEKDAMMPPYLTSLHVYFLNLKTSFAAGALLVSQHPIVGTRTRTFSSKSARARATERVRREVLPNRLGVSQCCNCDPTVSK